MRKASKRAVLVKGVAPYWRSAGLSHLGGKNGRSVPGTTSWNRITGRINARRFDLLDLGNDDPQRAYDGLNYVVSRSLGKITLPILEDEEAGVSKEDADAKYCGAEKDRKNQTHCFAI
jgi:hypothetical protein